METESQIIDFLRHKYYNYKLNNYSIKGKKKEQLVEDIFVSARTFHRKQKNS